MVIVKKKIKVELYLSNYEAKSDLKVAKDINPTKIAKNVDLTTLKINVDRLDINSLETISVSLSKLNNAVTYDVVKKNVYNGLVKKVNGLDLNKQCPERNIEDVDKKIIDPSKFIVNQEFNRLTKITFTLKMLEILKNFTTKNKVENTLGSGDKSREKTKKTLNIWFKLLFSW